MNEYKLTIVIVSYNVRELLAACLNSIYSNKPFFSVELIIVDNNSNDGSIEYIEKKYPDIIIIKNPANYGFSKANNQGIQVAKGRYVLLLNPDTEVICNALDKMVNFMDKHESAAILAPRLLNTDHSLQISAWKFPNPVGVIAETFYLHFTFRLNNYPKSYLSKTFEADAVSGAALMFRNQPENERFLDERLFWMDDVEFCYRYRLKYKKTIYYPKAQIIHHIGKSSEKNYKIKVSNQLISKIKFFRQYWGFQATFIITFFTFIHIISRILVLIFLWPFDKIFRVKLRGYLYALYKYFSYTFFANEQVS